jgi:hypothetical protein
MDWFSVAVGFLIGTATGAAGSYLADRFTDQRRDLKAAKEQVRVWKDIERRFPTLIEEMRKDFSGESGKKVRAFFVTSSRHTMGMKSEPSFEYYDDVHTEIKPALLLLEKHGYITDITQRDTPFYRVDESLVDRLLSR